MMKKIKSIWFLIIGSMVFLSACSGNKEGRKDDASVNAECRYMYQSAFTEVKWTAYKFTEKLGVGGRFDAFDVQTSDDASTIEGLVSGLSFNIPVSAINSDNPDRDEKIKKHFFGSMLNSESIQGKITALNMTDSLEGLATVELNMNNTIRTMPMKVLLNGLELIIGAEIDLADWNAQASVDSLNRVCDDLHKGADGKSYLWPTVNLEIKSTLRKVCPEAVAVR